MYIHIYMYVYIHIYIGSHQALIPGGKEGEFYDEMCDYFYLAQLRAQGEVHILSKKKLQPSKQICNYFYITQLRAKIDIDISQTSQLSELKSTTFKKINVQIENAILSIVLSTPRSCLHRSRNTFLKNQSLLN